MARADCRIVSDRNTAFVAVVAARTLRRRLDGVWSELQAACRPECDPETVHRLRVSTRRALAAFEVFEETIPRRARDWFARRLVRLRRAAGEARDLDVLGDLLSQDVSCPAGTRRRLLAMVSRRRLESGGPIRHQLEKLLDAEWPRRVDALVDTVRRRRRHRGFRSFTRRRFKPMVAGFFAGADHRLRSAGELHALRIAGKRLRYALEIFAPALPPGVGAGCQDSLERLQKTLGDFTDHAAAAERLARWARGVEGRASRRAIEALRDREEVRAEAARRTFGRWWDRTRRKAMRRRFEKSLRRESA